MAARAAASSFRSARVALVSRLGTMLMFAVKLATLQLLVKINKYIYYWSLSHRYCSLVSSQCNNDSLWFTIIHSLTLKLFVNITELPFQTYDDLLPFCSPNSLLWIHVGLSHRKVASNFSTDRPGWSDSDWSLCWIDKRNGAPAVDTSIEVWTSRILSDVWNVIDHHDIYSICMYLTVCVYI